MEEKSSMLKRPESWASTTIGAMCFLLVGLQMMAFEIPVDWDLNKWLQENAVYMLLFWLGLGPVGFAAGWISGFPRWSYPYTGMAFIMALYMSNVATPGIRILGHTFGSRDLWGVRSFIPLVLAVLVALIFSRPRNQLPRLLGNLFQEGSILSFLMLGCMPLLVMIPFDEIDRLYSLYYMALVMVLMVITAVLYLRMRSRWGSSLALIIGIAVIIAIVEAGSIVYWLKNGWVNVTASIIQAVIVALFLSAPALSQMLHDLKGHKQLTAA